MACRASDIRASSIAEHSGIEGIARLVRLFGRDPPFPSTVSAEDRSLTVPHGQSRAVQSPISLMPRFELEPDEQRDQELAQRVRLGDHAAYEELFRSYFGALAGFANSLISAPDVAEELAQNVLHRFWMYRNRDDFPPVNIGKYLFGALRKEAITHLRHQKVVERWEERVLNHASDTGAVIGIHTDEDTDALVRFNEIINRTRITIDELPPRCREVYLLCRQHGMSYNEIAQALGISRKTVEGHITNALRILRERLAAFL